MDKKTYISPEMECIRIAVSNIIASSPIGSGVYGQADSGSTGFAPEGSFFDDFE